MTYVSSLLLVWCYVCRIWEEEKIILNILLCLQLEEKCFLNLILSILRYFYFQFRLFNTLHQSFQILLKLNLIMLKFIPELNNGQITLRNLKKNISFDTNGVTKVSKDCTLFKIWSTKFCLTHAIISCDLGKAKILAKIMSKLKYYLSERIFNMVNRILGPVRPSNSKAALCP